MALVSPSSGDHWSRIRTRYATCRSVDRSTSEKSTQLLKCVWCFIIWRSESHAATDRLRIVALSLVLAANKEARADRALLIDLMLGSQAAHSPCKLLNLRVLSSGTGSLWAAAETHFVVFSSASSIVVRARRQSPSQSHGHAAQHI